MLPDIDAQDGNQSRGGLQRVLVGAGSDRESLPDLIVSQPAPAYTQIRIGIVNRNEQKHNSKSAPDPWTATHAADMAVCSDSTEPYWALIRLCNSPSGITPPPLLIGARFFQKIE